MSAHPKRSFKRDRELVSAFASQNNISSWADAVDGFLDDIPKKSSGYHIGSMSTDGDEITFYLLKYEDYDKSVTDFSLDLWDRETDVMAKVKDLCRTILK